MNIFREICRGANAAGGEYTKCADERIRELEQRLEKVTLACAGMWAVVRGQLGLTQSELADRMRELDLIDWRRDAKEAVAPHPVEVSCSGCGHTFKTCRPWCLYCGRDLELEEIAGSAAE